MGRVGLGEGKIFFLLGPGPKGPMKIFTVLLGWVRWGKKLFPLPGPDPKGPMKFFAVMLGWVM